MICSSKNEAVCREVQTHIGSSLPASFTGKVLGAIPRFVSPKIKRFAVKFRRILEAFSFRALYKMFWAHFPRFVRPKTKLFAVKFRRIMEVLCLRILQKKFWSQFHDLFVQERSCLPWNSDAFRKNSGCKVYRKSSGRNSTICASKKEAVGREIQTHFESSLPASFTKKLWAQFHDFCVKKWSGLLWSSEAFWKFSPCKLWKKISGCNFTIYASKNEVVCCEIQTHFGVLALRGLWKAFRAHYHDLCVQKLNCLPWCSDAFLKFSASKVYRESSGQFFTIDASKKEAVCCEVQTHFASFCLQDW